MERIKKRTSELGRGTLGWAAARDALDRNHEPGLDKLLPQALVIREGSFKLHGQEFHDNTKGFAAFLHQEEGPAQGARGIGAGGLAPQGGVGDVRIALNFGAPVLQAFLKVAVEGAALDLLHPDLPIEILIAAPDPVSLPERFPARVEHPRPEREMSELYARCDIFVFSSRGEGARYRGSSLHPGNEARQALRRRSTALDCSWRS